MRYYGVALEKVEYSVGISFLIRVEAVEIHYLQKGLVGNRRNGQIVDLGASGVVEILDVEAEVLFLNLICPQRVDIFHHQLPGRQAWVDGGGLEHLDKQGLVVAGYVRREFADAVDLSLPGILVGHGEDFVAVQGAFDRDIAQRRVQGVFAFAEQAGALDLFVVASAGDSEIGQRLQCLGDGVDIASSRIFSLDSLEQIVRLVAGHGWIVVRQPVARGHDLALADVGEGHEVAALRIVALLVGYPDFDARYLYARRHVGQLRREVVVVVAEILGQKEVAVLVILVGAYLEVGCLGTPFRAYALRFAVLLRHEAGHRQFAELKLGLDAEKRRRAAYERRSCRHADITGFDGLDDVVFFPLVGQLEVFRVEVEGGVGVVGHVEFHAVADAGVDGGLDFLVEVEECLAARGHRQRGIVGLVRRYPHLDLHVALGLQLNASGAEYLLEGP